MMEGSTHREGSGELARLFGCHEGTYMSKILLLIDLVTELDDPRLAGSGERGDWTSDGGRLR